MEKSLVCVCALTNVSTKNAGIVGSDEVFFEGNEQNLRDMYNEKSGSLDGDDDDVDVDLGSFCISDMKTLPMPIQN